MKNSMKSSRVTKRIVTATLAIILALAVSGCITNGQDAVRREMNADRQAYGRRSLPLHNSLNRKAQAWAEHLARTGSLSHSSLASGVPSCWRSLGENVGYGSSAAAVQDAYMRSSGHRANILNTKWNYVGVGYARNGSRVYTVQVFMQGC